MRSIKLSLAMLALFGTLDSNAAHARGGMAQDAPWNPDHISTLPSEVRGTIARVCGQEAHANHYFATFSDKHIRLHYERAHCRGDRPLCNSSGCLHQDYVLTGGHYKLLRSYYGPSTD